MARGHFKDVRIAITPLSGGSSWNFCGERVDYESEDEGRLMILRIVLSSAIFGAEDIDAEQHIFATSSIASHERDTPSHRVKDELFEDKQGIEARSERVAYADKVAECVVASFKIQSADDCKVRKKRSRPPTVKRQATKKLRFAASQDCILSSEALPTRKCAVQNISRKRARRETVSLPNVSPEDTTPYKAESTEDAFKRYLADNKDKMNVLSSIYPLLMKMRVKKWSPVQAVRQGLLIAKFYNPRFEALAKPYSSLRELLDAVYAYYEANSCTPVNTEAHAKTGLIDEAHVTLALTRGREAFVTEGGPRIFAALDSPSVAEASARLLQGNIDDAVRLLSELPFCSLHWAYLTLVIASDLNAEIREALESYPYIFDCISTMDLVKEFCEGECTIGSLIAFAKRVQSDTFTVQRRYWVFKNPLKRKCPVKPTLDTSKDANNPDMQQQKRTIRRVPLD